MGTITVTNLGRAYKQFPTRWSRLVESVLWAYTLCFVCKKSRS